MTASGTGNHVARRPDSGRVAAFFDLDKTIIATSSAFAFGRGFLDSGMISRSEALELFLTKTSYMINGQSSDKMDATRDRLADMVAGWPIADVRRVVADTMNTVVTPAIYSEARELIDWHREQGHDIVILSASASLLVEPIAEELGIDRVVATEVEVVDGTLTGKITRYLKGEQKAEAIRELVEKQGYDLRASYAYSDSLTDVPMLSLVGHPVAVNPERGLKKHAAEHGWDTRAFKNPEPLFDPPGAKEIGIGAGVVVTVTALTAFGIWLAQRGRGDSSS